MIEHTPRSMRDWFGWKKEVDEAGRPKYTFDGNRFYLVFQAWIMSRVVSTSDRMFRNYMDKGDPNFLAGLLDFTTGLRMKDMNLTEEQARRLRERRRQLEEALVRRGVMRQFTKAYEPRETGPVEF